jgi:hypothetical protein
MSKSAGEPTTLIAIAMMLTLTAAFSAPAISTEMKYPDLEGAWDHMFRPRWSDGEPGGKPPLTAEYMKVYERNLAAMDAGGLGDVPSSSCVPYGMPMMMNAYDPLEIIVTPKVTYILTSNPNDSYRRIYTDGRAWPVDIEPTFAGYSIGKWIDHDGDGTFDVLEVETRALRTPHTYDGSGTPFHADNKAFITERFWLDREDKDILHGDITVHDNALLHPWTKNRAFNRLRNHVWQSAACSADNAHVRIGKEDYFLSPDGRLMPTRRDQPPPDLTFFGQGQK